MDVEFWVEKCMRCVHCYIVKDDADELRCRCRNGCNFKEVKTNNECGRIESISKKYGL